MELERHGGGWQSAGELERGTMEVAGVRRTYWLARSRDPKAPLLIALHGSGMNGRSMAKFTGLAVRGPAAGITVVFPDGWHGVWHPLHPPRREPALDDAAFLRELSYRLEGEGAARSWPLLLTGMSSGAWFAEHLARNGLLPAAGLFLVAGTGLEQSRRAMPVPLLRMEMMCLMGTGDRSVPYDGGPLTRSGMSGWMLRRRAARHGELPGESVVAGAMLVAGDWAAGNGITEGPAIEELPTRQDDPLVTRLTWSSPGARPVTVYRFDGGGHGWPGGPQFLPVRVIGPIARHFDATGILLEMAERAGARLAGRRALEAG